jgi:hypothetical protein
VYAIIRFCYRQILLSSDFAIVRFCYRLYVVIALYFLRLKSVGSKTALTGETRFYCESGCIPETRTADILDGNQTVDPLDQWDCVLEWNCRACTTYCFWLLNFVSYCWFIMLLLLLFACLVLIAVVVCCFGYFCWMLLLGSVVVGCCERLLLLLLWDSVDDFLCRMLLLVITFGCYCWMLLFVGWMLLLVAVLDCCCLLLFLVVLCRYCSQLLSHCHLGMSVTFFFSCCFCVVDFYCWLLLLIIGVGGGSCCWMLCSVAVLDAIASSCYWLLLLVAVTGCYWRFLLSVSVVDYCYCLL